jgi:hypothetical protein
MKLPAARKQLAPETRADALSSNAKQDCMKRRARTLFHGRDCSIDATSLPGFLSRVTTKRRESRLFVRLRYGPYSPVEPGVALVLRRSNSQPSTGVMGRETFFPLRLSLSASAR